jgi:hypothetical protein
MPVSKRRGTEPGYARRTPWLEAIREVPSAWLEDEAKHSSSPHSLLAAWKGDRGVPAHVMLTLLRRRLREHNPELMQTIRPPGYSGRKTCSRQYGREPAQLVGSTQRGDLSTVSFGWHGSIWTRTARSLIEVSPATIKGNDDRART